MARGVLVAGTQRKHRGHPNRRARRAPLTRSSNNRRSNPELAAPWQTCSQPVTKWTRPQPPSATHKPQRFRPVWLPATPPTTTDMPPPHASGRTTAQAALANKRSVGPAMLPPMSATTTLTPAAGACTTHRMPLKSPITSQNPHLSQPPAGHATGGPKGAPARRNPACRATKAA